MRLLYIHTLYSILIWSEWLTDWLSVLSLFNFIFPELNSKALKNFIRKRYKFDFYYIIFLLLLLYFFHQSSHTLLLYLDEMICCSIAIVFWRSPSTSIRIDCTYTFFTVDMNPSYVFDSFRIHVVVVAYIPSSALFRSAPRCYLSLSPDIISWNEKLNYIIVCL